MKSYHIQCIKGLLGWKCKTTDIICTTIPALSHVEQSRNTLGKHMQVIEELQPIWVEFMLVLDQDDGQRRNTSPAIRISSGVISEDKERLYFCTKNGLVLELNGIDPSSDAGDLFEYDKTSKPPWKEEAHTCQKIRNGKLIGTG